MGYELISREPGLVIRRSVLEPGEATPWHTDPCRRFSVVVRGERLAIEYRDGGREEFAVHPGEADWNAPEARVHRAVNVGATTFEEVVTFQTARSDADPQPEALSPAG
jgi:quercetin dioxygenase-like cupin family protein